MNGADIIAAYEFALRQIVKQVREAEAGDEDQTVALQEIETLASDALAEFER